VNGLNRFIGKRLDGRYEIRELIGIGGMADVYKAFDVVEEKTVAVKILKEEYLTNEDFKRRFRNESKAIAVLSHPNIVKIFDVSFGDRVQFIVMEYVDGITLKEYIQQQKVVSWKETVHFTVQILRALQHAHDNGIVHRDIKPQNVMLLQDGTVKVMDFGIARFARDNGRTISEKAIGSVHYISPEQARGEVTDEKTDIYSVGVMMFEMLTGKLPFDGESPVAVAVKQMQAEAPAPRSINEDIPEGLEEIVVRAMKKDPDLRYQTAAEMLRDIDEFKRNPSVVFEYKYFTDDTSTKYFDTVHPEEEDVVVKKRISPVMQILLAVTGAFVIIAVIALVIFFSAINNPSPDTSVPTLIGMKYDDVMNDPQITDKFEIIKEGEELSDEYEAGYIIDQTPDPGKAAKEGQKIRVTVSSGLDTTTVPDVAGKTEEEALQILKDAGFETKVVAKFDNEVEKGLVTHTDPAGNTEAKKSEVIKVYVSTGSASKTVEVPNLVGKSESAAKDALTEKNLVCGGTTVVDSDQPKGTVVNQSIAAGTEVGEGTSITIQVSSGTPKKSTVNVPITFSGNVENKNFTIVAYLDGVQVGSYSVNPASGTWNLSLTEAGNKNLTLQVGGTTFATYQIDFDAGSVNQQGSTNMKPFLKQEEESSQPESSEEPESSDESSEE
jgi:serine/threonine protein kinase